MTNYGKIWQISHREVKDILQHKVLIEEKIDGSQFSFGKKDGKLWCDSHHQHLNVDACGDDNAGGVIPGLFWDAVKFCRLSVDAMVEGWTYRGEVLSKPKHNILTYNRVPKNNIVIFDIDRGNQDYLEYNDKVLEAGKLDLETVPQHYYGWIPNRASIDALLKQQPLLGGKMIEGLVIKAYGQYGADGKTLMCKIVNVQFREIAKTDANPFHVQKDTAEHIGKKYGTTARWDKAIQKLTEQNKLSGDMADMPLLMAEVNRDIMEEHLGEIKEALWDRYKKTILGCAKHGLAEYYKAALIERTLGPSGEPANRGDVQPTADAGDSTGAGVGGVSGSAEASTEVGEVGSGDGEEGEVGVGG